MANKVEVQILADVNNMVKGINQTNTQLGGLGDKVGKVTSLVKTMVGGFLAFQGVQAAVGFLKDSIGAASSLSESVSKTGQIFGSSAQGVIEWSKTTANSLGQSRLQALDAASTFAVFGKSAGLAGQDLNAFAIQNTQLASDLASFHDSSPQEAIEAIGAALRGEAEPMRRFGVLLDDASMRSKALEMGLISTTKNALTPQQKVLAAQALIMEQTADAQGDFARTSDGLANKQRQLSANIENVKTTLGSALLPAMTAVTGFILTSVIPAAQQFAKWFGENIVPALQNLWSTIQTNVLPVLQSMGQFITGTLVPGFMSMAQFIGQNSTLFGTLAVVLGTLYAGFTIYNTALAIWSSLTKGYAAVQLAFNAIMAINPFVLIIIGLTALVAGLIYAWKNSETFRNVVTGVWDAVKGAVMGVLNWFTGTLWPGIQNVYNFIKNGVQTVLSIYISVWAAIINTVMSVPGRIMGFFSGIVGFFTGLWDNVKSGAVNGFNAVVDFVRGIPGRILSAVGNLGSLLLNAGKDIISGLLNGITSKIGAVKDTLTGLTGKLTSWKGPESLDKVILKGAGELVITGFIKGLESQYKNVKQSLNSLTSDVAGTAFSSPSVALAGSGSGFARGGNTFNVTVNVPVGADPAQAGREVVKVIQAYEGQNGTGWRNR